MSAVGMMLLGESHKACSFLSVKTDSDRCDPHEPKFVSQPSNEGDPELANLPNTQHLTPDTNRKDQTESNVHKGHRW
jgi:hypothetical protein